MPEQQVGLSEVSLWGTALILGGVAACAFFTVLLRKLASTADPLLTVTLQQTVGLISVLVLLAMSGDAGILSDLSGRQWLGGSVSGLMYYVAAFWLYVFALRHIAASLAGAFLNIIPVLGIAMAYGFLGERLAPVQWIGSALVVGTMGVVLMWPNRVVAPQSADTLRCLRSERSRCSSPLEKRLLEVRCNHFGIFLLGSCRSTHSER